MMKRSLIVLITFCVLGASFWWSRPYFRKSFAAVYPSSTVVYAKKGELLRFTLTNDQKYRLWIPLKDISTPVVQSFLHSEDKHFYSHPGFNPWSLVRALWTTYFSGGRRTGASTITMQLARMVHEIDSRKPSGKISQILHSMKLELLYSKDEILEAYLNLVPMGGNIEGVGAASKIFFKQDIGTLDWAEAMLLAVIPQNPNKRTLLLGFNNEIKTARKRLADTMAIKSFKDIEPEFSHLRDLPFHAPHFVNEVLDRSSGKNIVHSTLDLELQKAIEKKIKNYLMTHKKVGLNNTAMVLLNWQTSEIVSWIGSASFFDSHIKGQVDGVTSRRSPGSTLKPFIYGLAIEEGMIHPGTILKDAPKSFGSYDPENFDGEFRGPLSAEEALNQSRNLPAVELVTKLKERDFYQFLLDAGVGIPRNKDHYGHSIALGGFELSLLELAKLYSILPRHGLSSEVFITKEEKNKRANLKRLLSSESSFLVLDMLSRANIMSSRFAKLAKRNNLAVSWKTGTSSGFRDAWTLGTFGPYVLGVWMGNFTGESNKSFIGREIAAPLFFEIIDTVKWHQGIDQQSILAWIKPQSVKIVEICPVSGKLPGHHCNHKKEIGFIPGTSPIHTCDVHRQIWVSKTDGTLSCKPDPKKDKTVVFEYWQTDLLEIYANAGFARKHPPLPGPNCTDTKISELRRGGIAPEILSPKEDTVYNLRSQIASQSMIPLQANIDSSAGELFWFVDDEFIGSSKSKSPVLWKARAGQFLVKAIDNLGRSTSRKILIRHVD